MMISPACATLHRREAMFTASPMAVYWSARELPMAPVTTLPVLMPMPMRDLVLALGGARAVELRQHAASCRARTDTALSSASVIGDRRAEQAR